jgi:hypothetical protein
MQLLGGKSSTDQSAGVVPKNASAVAGDIADDDIPF